MVDDTAQGGEAGKDTGAAQGAARQLTCFVVTGFGNKTDYATGRVLNLDKTYELLLRPACDAVGVNCFRAIDANVVGGIDELMYHWIYAADMVIADLSTLNANVFYELGVRHALKPNTTLLIAESDLIRRIPFDLTTFVVHKYDHGGDTITEAEQARFTAHLAGLITKILDTEQARLRDAPQLARQTDSPVFTFLKGLQPAAWEATAFLRPPPWVPPAQRPPRGEDAGEALSALIGRAEAHKDAKRYAEAIAAFSQAIARQTGGKPEVKPDIFLVQRLALVTYKHGERKDAGGKLDKAVALAALDAAWAILQQHCEPASSNDPETLGLAGAIHKRKFDHTRDPAFLNLSIWFYERGFYVKRDYYNGINAAFMYTLRANLLPGRYEAIVSHGHANMIRRLVVDICRDLMKDEAAFNRRGDRGWIVLSLAEAYQGLGETAEEQRLAPLIESLASLFGKDTYLDQRRRLQAEMDAFQQRVRPDALDAVPSTAAGAASVAAAAPPVAGSPGASATAAPAPAAPAVHATVAGQPILIDANLQPGRPIKAVKVVCRIEYE